MDARPRMKGNRGSGGERLPGFSVQAAALPQAAASEFDLPPARAPRRARWRRRIVILPAVAMIALIGSIIGIVAVGGGGDSGDAGALSPDANAAPELVAMPGTPTPTPEPTATPTVEPMATAKPGITPVEEPTAEPTPAGPVRVRHEVLPGQSCDSLRATYGFAPAQLSTFAIALGRISGRTPTNQCTFRQSDIVCIPTPDDLANIDALTRDTACLLGGTPAGG